MSAKSILRAVFGKFSHFYTKFGKLYQRKQKTKKELILSSTKKKERMVFRKEKIAKLEKLEKAQERKGK